MEATWAVQQPWASQNQEKSGRKKLLRVLDYKRQVVVCFAAGITSEQLQSWFGRDRDGIAPQIIRVIPNIAIEILECMAFISPINAHKDSIETVRDLFCSVGEALVVNEKQLEAGMALASCGLAFAMRYIRAAAEGGVELGMYPKEAISIVCQTVIGAANLITAHDSHPEAEIDKVTTPGSVTIKGLNEMEDGSCKLQFRSHPRTSGLKGLASLQIFAKLLLRQSANRGQLSEAEAIIISQTLR